jgi:hypothetical protein
MNFQQLLSLFFLVFPTVISSLTCSDVEKKSSGSLPCTTVPNCSTGKTASLTANQLSNGLGSSKASSAIDLCYTDSSLNVKVLASKQAYYPADLYSSCNDNVFLLDVVELFIGECTSSNSYCNTVGDTYCYSEIDTSPYNKIFESGIYTPYLNHTGIKNYLIDCDSSSIQHSVTKKSTEWTVELSIPWKVIYNPQGCPVPSKKAMENVEQTVISHSLLMTPVAGPGSVFRANVYRVNELTAVSSSCSSSTCEYISWTPTYSNPPAFHEPKTFGYFILA